MTQKRTLPNMIEPNPHHGILLLDKPKGKSSFYLVVRLRRLFQEKKIGHAGTLDPFATGIMIMLIGKKYTQMSDQFLNHDKEYHARARLGITTDSFDCEGQITHTSSVTPSFEEIQEVINQFQGEIQQIPPMFSAKKINGKKLYELARQGKSVERQPVTLTVNTQLIHYDYPYLEFSIKCSKGTYIRSIAHDMGQLLGCGAHLVELQRVRSGPYDIQTCHSKSLLDLTQLDFTRLQKTSSGLLLFS